MAIINSNAYGRFLDNPITAQALDRSVWEDGYFIEEIYHYTD